ncbi:serine carboxypeptidase-like 20 [Lotus japonicus]|uniref:serine carboxypeptidase-like 20 n=1 Tax=Lotus japonicus TaxID=34305 RepID=UPI00258B85DC|nr:serine carboxypeptidase-like 20 [Lotus japonicus]
MELRGMANYHKLLATSSLCIMILFAHLIFFVEAAPAGSLVTKLPGFKGNFPSKHYSGYVNIDGNGENGKNLFYYFVSSERNPGKDPVVLWLNGGPGCSSLDGFVYEHGPFNFQAAKTKGDLPILHINPYSWSKVSNIIYLDSPAGVGLSYSKNSSKYVTDDLQTASDTHAFLFKWFEQFPEFLANPFYLSGESYAGVYVPTLAIEVVKGIQSGKKPLINFKGYMIGNGVTDSKIEDNTFIPFVHGMGLISDNIYEAVEASCKGDYNSHSKNEDDLCSKNMDRVYRALDGLNVYNILEPCYHYPDSAAAKGNGSLLPLSFQQLGVTERPLPVRKRMFGRAWPFRAPVKDGLLTLWPELAQTQTRHVPCVDDEVASSWLNNDAVRKAIHAERDSVAGPWELCTSRIKYYHNTGESMIPYHKNLTKLGYRALIYSGDHDMCVPFTGSEAWTRSLGYKIVDEWRQWRSNNQVAGYLQAYENNLIFLTVKGAGHTVPEYKPREALDFYRRWLEGRPI